SRSTRADSSSCRAAFASRPTAGRSSAGSSGIERRISVRRPFLPRYRTRTCSRSERLATRRTSSPASATSARIFCTAMTAAFYRKPGALRRARAVDGRAGRGPVSPSRAVGEGDEERDPPVRGVVRRGDAALVDGGGRDQQVDGHEVGREEAIVLAVV